jgi:hypothetical protein
MINLDTALSEDFFEIPVQNRVSDAKEDREEDDLLWKLSALEGDHSTFSKAQQPYEAGEPTACITQEPKFATEPFRL